VVLTLKDAPILAEGEVNAGGGRAGERRDLGAQVAAGGVQGGQAAQQDRDKFVEEMEGVKRMLPQYDERHGGGASSHWTAAGGWATRSRRASRR